MSGNILFLLASDLYGAPQSSHSSTPIPAQPPRFGLLRPTRPRCPFSCRLIHPSQATAIGPERWPCAADRGDAGVNQQRKPAGSMTMFRGCEDGRGAVSKTTMSVGAKKVRPSGSLLRLGVARSPTSCLLLPAMATSSQSAGTSEDRN
jgi:hypothetical protein